MEDTIEQTISEKPKPQNHLYAKDIVQQNSVSRKKLLQTFKSFRFITIDSSPRENGYLATQKLLSIFVLPFSRRFLREISVCRVLRTVARNGSNAVILQAVIAK